MRIRGGAHGLDANKTEVVAYEKNLFRRKLTESLTIMHSPDVICNTGLSIEVSDMWAATVPSLRAALS